jgi:uncharacterized membrane-anchored protein
MPRKKIEPLKPALAPETRDRLVSLDFITEDTQVEAVNYVAEDNRTLEIINFDNGRRLVTVNPN